MGIMGYSLLWEVQDVDHQPYLSSKDPRIGKKLRGLCLRRSGQFSSGADLRFAVLFGASGIEGLGFRVGNLGCNI